MIQVSVSVQLIFIKDDFLPQRSEFSLYHLVYVLWLFHFSVYVLVCQAGPGSFSAALQDDARTDLNEVKGHLEIALLEKHFLREYTDLNCTLFGVYLVSENFR